MNKSDISVIKKNPAEGTSQLWLLLYSASDCHCISCYREKFVPEGLNARESENVSFHYVWNFISLNKDNKGSRGELHNI